MNRRADFHSLRHTFGTLLSKSGASPREAMELMRHTDLKLTMKVYTDPRIFDLVGRVENLPLPATEPATSNVATGTDGGSRPGRTRPTRGGSGATGTGACQALRGSG